MRAGDVARDGEAQARAALVLIARLVQAVKRPENVLAKSGVYSRSVVVDDDRQELSLPDRRNADIVRVTLGVGDEIADAALHRHGPNTDIKIASRLDAKARAMPLGSRVYWDNTAKQAVLDATGNALLGIAVLDAAAGDEIVLVRIG